MSTISSNNGKFNIRWALVGYDILVFISMYGKRKDDESITDKII